MTLPVLPEVGEKPWFGKRDAFDQAVRGRLNGTITPEDFGAVGDGVTDDTAAIQAAIDELQDGQTVLFGMGKTYLHEGTFVIPSTLSGITLDFNGATLQHAGLGPTLTSHTVDDAPGYGSGGNNWTFRNGTIRGDYAGGYSCIFNLHHVTGVTFEDCHFEEGMHSGGHYIDLLGCLDVYVGNCSFSGMNPSSNSEHIEAIQLDHSTYAGSSSKPTDASATYDGLPTRRVRVEKCAFLPIEVGGTWYPTPNPIGNHRSALTTDDGFVQEVWFEDNYVYGWHPSPTSSTAMRGWLHFLGARNIHVRRNTFQFWAPGETATGTIEHEAILYFQATTTVVTAATAGEVSPTSTAYVRDCRDIHFTHNTLVDFANHPAPATGYMVQGSGAASGVRVTDNTADSLPLHGLHGSSLSRSFFERNKLTITGNKRGVSWSAGDSNSVVDNDLMFDASSDGIGVQSRSGTGHIISGNRIWQGTIAIDIWGPTSYSQITNNRAEDYMTCGIKIANSVTEDPQVGDVLVAMNVLKTDLGSSHNSILIGSRGNRIRRFGNQCRNGGTLTDNGSGSITAATDQTS